MVQPVADTALHREQFSIVTARVAGLAQNTGVRQDGGRSDRGDAYGSSGPPLHCLLWDHRMPSVRTHRTGAFNAMKFDWARMQLSVLHRQPHVERNQPALKTSPWEAERTNTADLTGVCKGYLQALSLFIVLDKTFDRWKNSARAECETSTDETSTDSPVNIKVGALPLPNTTRSYLYRLLPQGSYLYARLELAPSCPTARAHHATCGA
jgi:hypothetical protein